MCLHKKELTVFTTEKVMNIKELSQYYIKCFGEIHEKYNFIKESAVSVSSRVDSSVFFVGSTISVLKPYLLKLGGYTEKRYLVQPAIRTQQLRNMENGTDNGSCYGSFFLAMGDLAPYSCLSEVFYILFDYLNMIFSDNEQKLMFRVSSRDKDLLECCEQHKNQCLVEIDSRTEKYYYHHYGLDSEEIYGRNCNIAVAPKEGIGYKDIANIIVIEKNGIPFAVELAIGLSTLICHAFGLEHTMKGNIVADLFEMNNIMDYWLGDCFSVITCLESEGVKINSSHMQGRLLKRYIKVMDSLCKKLSLLEYDRQEIIKNLKDEYSILLGMLV